jgi:hypothetical protein
VELPKVVPDGPGDLDGPGELDSSPPIIKKAAPAEDDIINKTTTPSMAVWDIYSNLTFFCVTTVKDNHGSL